MQLLLQSRIMHTSLIIYNSYSDLTPPGAGSRYQQALDQSGSLAHLVFLPSNRFSRPRMEAAM